MTFETNTETRTNLSANARTVNDGRFYKQAFMRRISPMYFNNSPIAGNLYTDFFPSFATDVGSWSDFFGQQQVADLAAGFTLRQYVPGTYAARLDLAALGLWPDGSGAASTININTRSALTGEFRHGAVGTYSFGIWGCKSANDFLVVDVTGKKLWEDMETTERYEIRANEVGLNVAPAGGIVPASTLPDLISPWMMNAGTLGADTFPDVPQPRGWYGRWGSTPSDDAWLYIKSVRRVASSIDVTGTSHGWARHPFFKSLEGEEDLVPPTGKEANYFPEFFIHQHEPMFHTPWPNAKRSQLIAVRIVAGAGGITTNYTDFSVSTLPSYLVFSDSGARSLGVGDVNNLGDGATTPGVVGAWVGENTVEGRLDSRSTGEVWGISNSDDTAIASGIASTLGDGPVLDMGSIVEAWWDPRN